MEFNKEIRIPKIYKIMGLIALIFAGILIAFSIYNQFFYVDGTWTHGLIANGFAILSGLIWIGILFVFKRFLTNLLNYNKASLLINAYIIFLAITIISLASVVIKSIKLYQSIEEIGNIDAVTGFASSSILGAIFIMISNFAIILICILLGNRIRKIGLFTEKLFKILGFSFIIYGISSLLVSINIIEIDSIQFVFLAFLSTLIGLILKKVYDTDYSDSLIGLKKAKNSDKIELKTQKTVAKSTEIKKSKKLDKTMPTVLKEESEKNNLPHKELPNINWNEVEDKELIFSYYANLPKEELSRLENIIEHKYKQNLTKEQKSDLVKYYIAEKKLYDHQRFLPK